MVRTIMLRPLRVPAPGRKCCIARSHPGAPGTVHIQHFRTEQANRFRTVPRRLLALPREWAMLAATSMRMPSAVLPPGQARYVAVPEWHPRIRASCCNNVRWHQGHDHDRSGVTIDKTVYCSHGIKASISTPTSVGMLNDRARITVCARCSAAF